MDLIPRQYKKIPPVQGGVKSRGISIAGLGPKLSLIFKRRMALSVFLVAAALLVFGGIKGDGLYLKSKIKSLETEIKNIESSQDTELAKKLIETENTTAIVQNLLGSHIYSSQFFEILEKITLPNVQWLSVELNTTEGMASFKGRASSYSLLAQQIVSFEQSDFQVSISQINLTSLGVEFSAKANFDKGILQKEQ